MTFSIAQFSISYDFSIIVRKTRQTHAKNDRRSRRSIRFFFFFTYPNISNHYKFQPREQWKIARILGNFKLVLPLIMFYDHGFYEAANFDVESFMNAIEILHKYFPPNFQRRSNITSIPLSTILIHNSLIDTLAIRQLLCEKEYIHTLVQMSNSPIKSLPSK